MPPRLPEPAELADLAVRLATEAATLIAGRLDGEREVTVKSTPTDPVTEMDTAAEALLRAGLAAERPDDGVVGEEGDDVVGRSGVRWHLDPIDGTVNYLYRLPGFGVSVAAEVDGVVVAGAVVDPLHRDTWAAVRGGGATRNGRPLRRPALDDLSAALVATGFSYQAARRRTQAAVLVEVLPRVRDLRRLGAASLDLCRVGSGQVDGYWEKGLASWDRAAGELVAAEAGARVGRLPTEAGADVVVAAAPGVYDALVELLVAAGADSA